VLLLGHLVRFSHSIFALPFALASAACAAAFAARRRTPTPPPYRGSDGGDTESSRRCEVDA
jgi:hypothetical protein